MIVPQVTLSMDVTKVDAQAFEFFVNPIQSQNLQIWQGYHLSIFKSYVFLQNLEGIAQELNMRLLGYCGRWISHEGPLQGSGTSIIPNSDPPSSLSYRTTPLVPVWHGLARLSSRLAGNNKYWLNNFKAQCKNIYYKHFLKPGKISNFLCFK